MRWPGPWTTRWTANRRRDERDPMRGVRATHVGGPTVLIEIGGWRLLTDPTFDAPGRKYSFGCHVGWASGQERACSFV
jgi:hypothetical protein